MSIFNVKPKKHSVISFDIVYSERCPICKEEVKQTFYSSEFPIQIRKLLECPICHIAIFGYRKFLKKIFREYIEDVKSPSGLKEISHKEI